MNVEIKYSYAIDLNGKPVYIEDAVKGESYKCPQCGNEMIPKLGDINAHHFAHKVECSCNGESYLHKIAKLKFKEAFDEAPVFILEYRTPVECPLHYSNDGCRFSNNDCNHYTKTFKQFNLKHTFDTCLIEESVNNGEFIADILLKDSTGRSSKILLIEFFHTHRCDLNKVKSGLPIVEIKIENEDDIISTNRISASNKIIFHGFKSKSGDGRELYYVSFEDDSNASDLKVSKINCSKVFDCNYNDYYECNSAFVVAIDPLSYDEFSHDPRFRKNPPSLGAVACAIAYLKGFKKFENCAVCLHSRRSQFNETELWCTQSKESPSLPKNPKGVKAYNCDYFLLNQNRIKFIAKHLKNLKYEVLRCELPYEYD